MKKLGCFLALLIFSVVASGASSASQVVPQVPFSTKTNLKPGKYILKFSLWDTATGGSAPVWSEVQTVTLTNATVKTRLGIKTPLAASEFSQQLWVQVERRRGTGSYAVIGKRTRLAPGPYALWSETTGRHTHAPVDLPSETDPQVGSLTANQWCTSNASATGIDCAQAAPALATHDHFGLSWTGSSSSPGLSVGNAGSGDGVDATASAAGKSALYGHSAAGYGATLRSTTSFGAQVGGGGDSSWSDLVGDLRLEGDRGEIFTPGTVLELYSNGFIALDLDNDNNGNNQFEIWNGAEALVFSVNEAGNTTATGTKSAVVQTQSYGRRLMYSVESPEVWFEDFGKATLVNGATTVAIDPVFAETANLAIAYHVFVTAVCQEPVVLFVSEKTAANFTVKGVNLVNAPSACGFDYRVTAKRLGNEAERLAPLSLSTSSRGSLE